VERKSRFYLVIRIKDKTAIAMHNAIIETLEFPRFSGQAVKPLLLMLPV
jgi:hypothetical protein